jgi:hypothetical protein
MCGTTSVKAEGAHVFGHAGPCISSLDSKAEIAGRGPQREQTSEDKYWLGLPTVRLPRARYFSPLKLARRAHLACQTQTATR